MARGWIGPAEEWYCRCEVGNLHGSTHYCDLCKSYHPNYVEGARPGGVIEYDPNGPIPMFVDPRGTDPDWVEAHDNLLDLHIEKSRRYGNNEDRLANLTAVAKADDRHGAHYPVLRIIEKCQRALELIKADEIYDAEEFLDIAGLALCAEVMTKRERG